MVLVEYLCLQHVMTNLQAFDAGLQAHNSSVVEVSAGCAFAQSSA
jgi:hypothetical protein